MRLILGNQLFQHYQVMLPLPSKLEKNPFVLKSISQVKLFFFWHLKAVYHPKEYGLRQCLGQKLHILGNIQCFMISYHMKKIDLSNTLSLWKTLKSVSSSYKNNVRNLKNCNQLFPYESHLAAFFPSFHSNRMFKMWKGVIFVSKLLKWWLQTKLTSF